MELFSMCGFPKQLASQCINHAYMEWYFSIVMMRVQNIQLN
jgi:hypothetical protein